MIFYIRYWYLFNIIDKLQIPRKRLSLLLWLLCRCIDISTSIYRKYSWTGGVRTVGATDTSISVRLRSRRGDSRVSTLLLIILSPFTVVGRSAVILLLPLSLVLQCYRATNTRAVTIAALVLSRQHIVAAPFTATKHRLASEEGAGCRTR